MREIIYIHLPTFYVKMQIQAEPALAGRPLIIEEHGFIKSASPEALALGILPGSRASAARHCLQIETRPYDPECCRRGAFGVWDLLSRFSPLVEPDTFDGAFLDITGCGNASALTASLTATVWDSLELISNVGRATSKFVAKIAAWEANHHHRKQGACSFTRAVYPGGERSFLAGLPVSYLWPLDAAVTRKLVSLGLYTIGEITNLPEEHLLKEFGAEGRRLASLCQGEDRDKVQALYPAPRIIYRETLLEGCSARDLLTPTITQLAERVAMALDRSGREARHLALVLETEKDHIQQTKWLVSPTANRSSLARSALDLLNNCSIPAPIYGVALQAEELQLAIGKQLGFFVELAKAEKEQTMDSLLSSLKDRFGLDSVDLARAYEPPRRELILSRYYN